MRSRSAFFSIVVVIIAAVLGLAARRAQAPAANAAVVKAAEAFLGTLDATGRAKAQIDLNAKTRTVWSNLPSGIAMQVGAKERNGLKIGDMTPAQEKAALALLSTALSKDGYQKVMQIVDADELLEQRSAPTRAATQAIRFGRKEFYFAILGKPSATDTWMLQFGGHHLAINVTYAGRAGILAPTHTGTQPATYSIEGRAIRPLGDENDKAFALMNSLSPDQQKQASIGTTMRNLVLGPGEDGKMIAPEGANASTFTAAQKGALLDLIGEWVGILGDAAAAAKMAEVKANIDETHFAWSGPTGAGTNAYFRIQGPTVFIEYAPQGKETPSDHIHTIYRDPTNDYAAKATVRVIRILAVAGAVLLTAGGLAAHGLDEYVQAARVDVALDSVVVHLGLTPGVAVAPAIIAHVDRDRDGLISPAEAETYGREVVGDLTLTSDGAPVGLGLTRIEAPPPGEMRDGVGTIRIEAVAHISATTGARQIALNNQHRPAQSVYLANALLPETDAITIRRQERNATQQHFRLDYDVARQPSRAIWLVVAAALLLGLAAWRVPNLVTS